MQLVVGLGGCEGQSGQLCDDSGQKDVLEGGSWFGDKEAQVRHCLQGDNACVIWVSNQETRRI